MHTRDLIKRGVKAEKLALVQAWEEAPSTSGYGMSASQRNANGSS
jgi:hypothetical protein